MIRLRWRRILALISAVLAVSLGLGATPASATTALTFSKSFSPGTIALNDSSTLTFTINNPDIADQTGIAFTDTLPTGLVVGTPPATSGTCNGAVTAVAGSGSISLSGGSILTSDSCTIGVSVTATAAGTLSNTTGPLTSNEGGGGATASDSLTVIPPLVMTKSFGAATVAVNGTTSMTLAINNPSSSTGGGGMAVADSFPAGLIVATPANVSNNGCGGNIFTSAGSSSVTSNLGFLGPLGSCSITLNVTVTTVGPKVNSATVTGGSGGDGPASTATITGVTPLTIAKSFGAATIPVGTPTSLSLTITNPDTLTDQSGVAVTDNLPAGMVVATPNGLSSTCGGTMTAVAGANSVHLTGGSVVATGNCVVSLNVKATSQGIKTNTTGAVTSTQAGSGGNSGPVSITAIAPLTIAKAFGASIIPAGTTTSLSLTITNPDTSTVQTGVAFTDTFPAGLTVASPSALAGTCGGGTVTAVAGSGSVTLTGGSIVASGSCLISLNVTATSGLKTNTTGTVSSTEGGTGGTSGAMPITGVVPLSIVKAFGAASVAVGASTSLTLTITNPDTFTTQTGIAVTDNLPAGMVVATPNALVGTCGGGTVTAVAGSTSVALTGGSISATGNCAVSVNITPTSLGLETNTTGAVSSTQSGTGGTSGPVSLTAIGPPTISKAFGVATMPISTSTSLTFTVTNPNAGSSLTNVSFSDPLPVGLLVATPNGLTGSCGGGTITAVAGAASIALSASTLAATLSCTFVVNVTGVTAGAQNNATGAVTSTQGGTGLTASASVLVVAPPTIAKGFGVASIPINTATTVTFTITNPNTGSSLGAIGFTDSLPGGLVVSTPNGLTGTCGGGTITAVAGSGAISLSASTLVASASCSFTANVTGIAGGNQINTTSAVTSTQGGTGLTASASLLVMVVPGAPTIGSAVGGGFGSGNATVSFTAPGSDGGSPILHYDVISVPAGGTGTVAGPGSGTILVTGLANGVSYGLSVTATNAIGTGPASASAIPVFNPIPSPVITSVSPTGGLPAGGTVVTVIGTGFSGTSAVMFGTVAGTNLSCSSTSCTVTSPAGSGAVNISVTAAGGSSGVAAAAVFTYSGIPAPAREAGADRTATAIAVSTAEFPTAGSASAVVLVRPDNFPDALAGVPLAVARKAPVLLTPTASLDPGTQTEIARVLAPGGTIYLLGGTEALSATLESTLHGLGYPTVRYQGADRFATAAAVAAGLGNPTTILLADGTGFPDALSAGAAAAKAGGTVLLTDGSTMPAATAAYLAAHPGDRVEALGGPAAAADPAAPSLIGTDRYDTSAMVATHYFTKPTSAGVASGLTFPDALSGGVQLGMAGAPLLLTDPTTLPPTVAAYLHANASNITSVFVYGGSAAVSDAVLAAVHAA